MARKKFTVGTVAATSLVLGASLLTAMPANAAERTFGYLNCPQGSIYTQANATQAQRHHLVQGSSPSTRDFPSSGSAYATRTWYSGLKISANGGVNTVGVISSASQNCAD